MAPTQRSMAMDTLVLLSIWRFQIMKMGKIASVQSARQEKAE